MESATIKLTKMFALLGLFTLALSLPLTLLFIRQQPKHYAGQASSSQATSSNVTGTIDTTTPIGKSTFSPGLTNIDTSLFFPWTGNDQTAVKNAKALISKGIPFVNVHIMAWGADDPWPDPAQKEPSNWDTLDQKLRVVLDAKATPVITLSEAPWWMKGRLNADGTTTLLTKADDFGSIAYGSRILDNKMDAWLHLVRRVAERYMVAPYNVRYFQVWNELKGYYNPSTNNWDMSTSAGDPTGPYAKHGYTYMYNRVYDLLKKVAATKGINPATIKIGGSYSTMDTWSSKNQSNPSNITKAYGTYDQRSLDALTYWLHNKAGADFITVDGSNENDDAKNITDPFTASEKFADVVTWIRSLNSRTYPGAASMAIWWAEWHASPYGNVTSEYDNAVKSYAMIKLLKAGGAVAFEWGSAELWTSTAAKGGGQPLPWYGSYKALHDYFGPGTSIYKTTSSSSRVEILASRSKTMLVNKTANELSVTVNKLTITLNPYEVRVIRTP